MTTPAAAAFAAEAQDFEDWYLAGRVATASEIAERLMRLYLGALRLEVPVAGQLDASGFNPEKNLEHDGPPECPLQYYPDLLEPLKLVDPGYGLGDLLDDLGDILRDLAAGLTLWREGREPAAVETWRFSFWTHWGEHAVGPLRALHAIQAEGKLMGE